MAPASLLHTKYGNVILYNEVISTAIQVVSLIRLFSRLFVCLLAFLFVCLFVLLLLLLLLFLCLCGAKVSGLTSERFSRNLYEFRTESCKIYRILLCKHSLRLAISSPPPPKRNPSVSPWGVGKGPPNVV